jgi:hypothetical protein
MRTPHLTPSGLPAFVLLLTFVFSAPLLAQHMPFGALASPDNASFSASSLWPADPASDNASANAADNATLAPSSNQYLSFAERLENSRDAGLLTDWHLQGCYGRDDSDFKRHFAPERVAAKLAAKPPKHFEAPELVFADGTFVLIPDHAAKGVFYAQSSTWLASGGEWNIYLESGAPAAVFVDGHQVIARGSHANGVLRATIHLDGGYHAVLVKFVAQAAPFRVAILPPNSGSRRKNNTPYLQASPASEDMMAALRPIQFPAH